MPWAKKKEDNEMLEPGIYYCIETFNNTIKFGDAILVLEKEKIISERTWGLKIIDRNQKIRTLKRVETAYFPYKFSRWFSKTPPSDIQ